VVLVAVCGGCCGVSQKCIVVNGCVGFEIIVVIWCSDEFWLCVFGSNVLVR